MTKKTQKKNGARGLKHSETTCGSKTSPRLPQSLPVAERGKSAAPLAAAFPHRAPGGKPHGNPSVCHGFPEKGSVNVGMFMNVHGCSWILCIYVNLLDGIPIYLVMVDRHVAHQI